MNLFDEFASDLQAAQAQFTQLRTENKELRSALTEVWNQIVTLDSTVYLLKVNIWNALHGPDAQAPLPELDKIRAENAALRKQRDTFKNLVRKSKHDALHARDIALECAPHLSEDFEYSLKVIRTILAALEDDDNQAE